MTFLAVSQQVDAVITEDSDLIAFGCPRIIYKMDKFGQGVEFQYSMLERNKELNFTGFTKQMLLEMCILSGCDYLQSLPGMGLKKAHALVKKFRSYDKVIKHLQYSTIAVSPSYEESFKKAILTFQHQRVYDTRIEDIVHLSDLPGNVGDDLDFLGPYPLYLLYQALTRDTSIPQPIATGIARGDLDPFTKIPFQGTNNGADLVVDGTYKPQNFKPQGFASLEAKRRFRAPRSKPKHPNPMNETSCYGELVTKEAVANCSFTSLLDYRYLGITSRPEGHVNNGDMSKSLESLDSPSHGFHHIKDTLGDKGSPQDPSLQLSRQSIHKPCMTLHRERDRKGVSEADEGITGKENTKVVVSSYFQQKLAKENDEKIQNKKLLGLEDVTTRECVKNILARECKSASSDAGEVPIRIKNRKTIVRSSYFLQKSGNENDEDSIHKKLLVEDDLMNRTREYAIPESASSGDSCFNSPIMKRKAALVDNVQMENTNCKNIRMNASLPTQSGSISTLDDTIMEMKAEGGKLKFGCNISHLDDYSGIAEKSMESFVSLISSFKCSSSGSRASGLRAPLKDLQNTCTSRSKIGVDLSEFAYVPTTRKASSSYRRA
ncbi:hypothetical protein U1Q18_009449 [Sarracenia purpurea var. burkii]